MDDLNAFIAVARERSFTRAAAKLGVSQSALSQTIRNLETRLDLRLLTRTTRSVGLTEAGGRLLDTIGPLIDGVIEGVAALNDLRDRPTGTIRINCDENCARNVLLPVLNRFLPKYPDIKVEVTVDYGLVDIAAKQYDAGVRGGEVVAKDMIAVRIGPDMRMIVVASPAYLTEHGVPVDPHELTLHRCINFRMATYGGIYAWEFAKNGRELNVDVDGPLVFNSVGMISQAAVAGHGLACVPDMDVAELINRGELVRVLDDWCEPYSGYHLYYPHRRQPTPAFSLLVDALRYRGS